MPSAGKDAVPIDTGMAADPSADSSVPPIRRAIGWLGGHQNADGGFGNALEAFRRFADEEGTT